jgi:hypothetical protein
VKVRENGQGLGKLDVGGFSEHVGGLEVFDESTESCGIVTNRPAEETQASLCRVLGNAVTVEA